MIALSVSTVLYEDRFRWARLLHMIITQACTSLHWVVAPNFIVKAIGQSPRIMGKSRADGVL